MDQFESKHNMMKMLIDMLKKSAADEVSSGMQKPEGEGDMHGMEVEKVEVLPDHKMDDPTPEHDVKPEGLADGGKVTEPEGMMPDKMGAAEEEAGESEAERRSEGDIEDDNLPPFATLFGKKKKK